jgi:hypothetical protein
MVKATHPPRARHLPQGQGTLAQLPDVHGRRPRTATQSDQMARRPRVLGARKFGLDLPPRYGRPQRWTYARIKSELIDFVGDRPDWPALSEFEAAGLTNLYNAIRTSGARGRLAAELLEIPRAYALLPAVLDGPPLDQRRRLGQLAGRLRDLDHVEPRGSTRKDPARGRYSCPRQAGLAAASPRARLAGHRSASHYVADDYLRPSPHALHAAARTLPQSP